MQKFERRAYPCVVYIPTTLSCLYSPETDTILYFSTSFSSGGTSGRKLTVCPRVTLFREGYLSREEEVVSSEGGENGDSIVNCEHAYVSSKIMANAVRTCRSKSFSPPPPHTHTYSVHVAIDSPSVTELSARLAECFQFLCIPTLAISAELAWLVRSPSGLDWVSGPSESRQCKMKTH